MKLPLILKRFFKRTKVIQPVVIFDIGSSSIGGAVVYFNKEVPNISYCTRVQLPFQEEADIKRLLPQIDEYLTSVASELQKNGLQSKDGQSIVPSEIVCVFSSLWSNTQTTSASFENKEKFIVTDNVMNNLLVQIHENNKQGKEDASVTIEEIVINSSLNGYSTQSPLGKQAERINVTFLESTISEQLHTKINDVIHKIFSPDIPLVLRSFTLVSFSVARDMFEHVKDFLIIDVTGEVTELAIVRDSILGDTLSFPYGKNTIVRDVVKKTKSVPEDILARIKIALSNKGSEIKDIIFEEEKQWTEMFGKACGDLSSDTKPLPQTVFLITDTDYEGWFNKMIERVDFSQFTVTKKAFDVIPFMSNKVESSCTTNNGVFHDNFLAIDTLFYNREYLSSKR